MLAGAPLSQPHVTAGIRAPPSFGSRSRGHSMTAASLSSPSVAGLQTERHQRHHKQRRSTRRVSAPHVLSAHQHLLSFSQQAWALDEETEAQRGQ